MIEIIVIIAVTTMTIYYFYNKFFRTKKDKIIDKNESILKPVMVGNNKKVISENAKTIKKNVNVNSGCNVSISFNRVLKLS